MRSAPHRYQRIHIENDVMNDPLVRKSTRGNFLIEHLIEQQKIQIQQKVDFIIFTAQNYFLESLI